MKKLVMTLAFGLALVGLLGNAAVAQPKDDELNRPKDYSNDFQVPPQAGAPRVANITEDFEGGTPPTGIVGPWITNDYAGTGIVWDSQTGMYCGEADNWTGNALPGTGDFACVSSDMIGTLDFDTDLWTEVYNFVNANTPALLLAANYQNFANEDFFQIDWSNDGGTTWQNLLLWNEDHGAFRADPGEDINLALGPAVGEPNVWFRFYYWDPAPDDFEWYIEIDDFVLDDSAGGLITAGGGMPAASGPQLALLALLLILGGAAFVVWRSRVA